jgi:hypothetical protein
MVAEIILGAVKLTVDGVRGISSAIRTGNKLRDANQLFSHKSRTAEEQQKIDDKSLQEYLSDGYEDASIDVFGKKKKGFFEKIKQNFEPQNRSSTIAKPFKNGFSWLSGYAANRILGIISIALNIALNVVLKGKDWAQESVTDFIKLGSTLFIDTSMELSNQSQHQEVETKTALIEKIGQLHAKIQESGQATEDSSYLHEQKLDEEDMKKVNNKWYGVRGFFRNWITYAPSFFIFLVMDVYNVVKDFITKSSSLEKVQSLGTLFIDLISGFLADLGDGAGYAADERKSDMMMMAASKHFKIDIDKMSVQALRETYVVESIKYLAANVNIAFIGAKGNTITLKPEDIDMKIVNQYLKEQGINKDSNTDIELKDTNNPKNVKKNDDGSITVTKQGYFELKLRAFLADPANRYEYDLIHNKDSLITSIKNTFFMPLFLQNGETNCIGEGFRGKEEKIKNIKLDEKSFKDGILTNAYTSGVQMTPPA